MSMAVASDLSQWEVDQTPQSSFEVNSPSEYFPGTVEPGLSERAVPMLPPPNPPEQLLPFYQLQKFQNIQEIQPKPLPDAFDPSSFRPVNAYLPPIGLHPRVYRNGLIEFYPWFGIAQSFDSNVNLVSAHPVSDFYVTPRLGAELQVGTPDSIYNEFYDTILAMNIRYEAWADIFYENPQFSAFNQEVRFAGRVGRSGAIWRPSFTYSDITGSNLLMSELVNRTRRLTVNAELLGQYQFTSDFGANQTFGYYQLDHPDPGYINYAVAKTRQELTWKVLDQMKVTAYGDYRYLDPAQGSLGSEVISGVGFYGKPDSRIYTELRMGYGEVMMDGSVPGRRNMSGLRFNGFTTFDWSPRFRLTFRYDRDYVLNEVTVNDNYVSTLLQLKGEIFLGGNWYVTPYLGCSTQDFETSQRLYLQVRPEMEVAYAFAGNYYPGDSKIFAKIGYMSSESLQGAGDPVVDWRLSVGFNCKF
jgi:hypothetical protein